MASKSEQTKALTDPTLDVLLNEVEGATAGASFAVTSSKMALNEIGDNMIMAGLVELRVEGEITYGRLPVYEGGHSVSISTRTAATATALVESDGDEDMVDEDELLERDGLPTKKCPPMNGAELASAKSAGRKPCKDCSCGLASVNDDGDGPSAKKEVNAKDMDKSNCGNCSLGDAFRCAGCPYLGLPPFKPGEKVSISSTLMTTDI